MTLLRQAEFKKINFRRSATVVMALLIGEPVLAASQKIGDPPEASNIRLVGFNDLQGRSAYQPTIHHQGDRWIAYIGLAVILYVAGSMIYNGWIDNDVGIFQLFDGR